MRWIAGIALLACSLARAGALADADPNAPVAIHARLTGSTVNITARYELEVPDLTSTSIEIPDTAVVTAATAIIDGTRRSLALMSAQDASQRWTEVTEVEADDTDEVGGSVPWTILISRLPQDRAEVSVDIQSPPDRRFRLELELTTPGCFFRDARYVPIPDGWTARVPVAFRVPASVPEHDLSSACGGGEGDRFMRFPTRELIRPRSTDHLNAAAARLDLPSGSIARFELDVARTLGAVPDDLVTAIIVDGSASMTAEQRAAQNQLVVSYLERAPRGRIQLIAYDRRAHALLPDWATASNSAPAIERALASLTPRNGSNLDAGLAEAGRWLERATGTRRIVLFSDERLASRLAHPDAAKLRALVPADALIHVVAIDRYARELERDDDALLAPLAAVTQGLSARAGLDPALDATMLTRPISIDAIAIHGPGWTGLGADTRFAQCNDDVTSVVEGSSCTWWGRGEPDSGVITVEGRIWGRPITRVLTPDPRHAIDLARELVAQNALADDPLAAEAADASRAVSAEWSLFGTWGEPGHPELGSGVMHGSSISTTCSGYGTTGTGSAPRPTINDLDAQLAASARGCAIGSHRIEVSLEVTLAEIVEVEVVIDDRGEPAAERAKLHDCVEDAVWNTSLVVANPVAFARHHVTLTARPGAVRRLR